MPLTFSGPGAYSTYVPSAKDTGGLIVAFSRNPSEFPLNKYMQMIEVGKMNGYYQTYRSINAARVEQANLARHVWADSMPAPTGLEETDKFTFNPYKTTRYVWPYAMGDLASDQADPMDLLAQARADAAQQSMTARSLLAASALSTADWASVSNTDTGSALGGGFWNAGTETSPILKVALNKIRIEILKKTLGAVRSKDLILVINPNTAAELAKSQEIHTYLRNQPGSYGVLEGDKKQFDDYGLLPVVYGFQVVVDDTVVATSKEGATDVLTFTIPDNTAYVLSRPGKLVGPKGGRAHSTLTMFWYQDEMTTEEKHDPDNRLTRGRVISNFQVQVVSPKAGFKVTNVLS
jgi:hypothetical protein